MDHKLEIEFQEITKRINQLFDADMDLNGIMTMIGVQELGHGFREFSKDEKLNLMHIATCTILEPYGYYEYSHDDEDGWPHFNNLQKLPPLTDKQQEHLLKEAIIQYFKVNAYLEEE
ncbi:MAG: hypothetical protein R3279_12820 [Putridiphycobacter sp.]|nr:hypothetical protein [Putridiphycobacter sp.]